MSIIYEAPPIPKNFSETIDRQLWCPPNELPSFSLVKLGYGYTTEPSGPSSFQHYPSFSFGFTTLS